MGRVGTVLLVGICAVVLVGSAGAASSPTSLRAAILKAVSARHSVHYVVVDTGKGYRTSMVSDVAVDRGIQRITVIRSGRTGHVTVLVIKSTVYFRGDAFGLHSYMALTTGQASRYAGRWLSIGKTSPVFASVAADVTFASFASHLLPQHHLVLANTTVGGRKLIGVRGVSVEEGVTLFESVFAPARGVALPVEATAVVHGPHGGSGRTSMSHWNEAVHLTAPAHSIQF